MSIFDLIFNLKKETGFDALENDEFIEYYFSKILNGKTTKNHDAYDCILKDGIRLEIKSSKPVFDKRIGRIDNKKHYFIWTRLFGSNRNKVGNVDYIVLCGRYKEKFYIWIIPFNKVKKDRIEKRIISDTKKRHWIDRYYIGDENDMINYFKQR